MIRRALPWLALLSVLLLVCALPWPAAAVSVQRVIAGDIEAWLVEDHATPVISLRLAFRGGAALDPPSKVGLAAMTMALLDEGAGDREALAFQRRLKELAVSMSFDTGPDAVGGELRTLTENREAAFALLGDALARPRFDADAIARVRGQMQARLRRDAEDPDVQARRRLMTALLPESPYGRPDGGTEEGIAAIDRADMEAFARANLVRSRLVVAVAGDVSATELSALLARTFGPLPTGRPAPSPPKVEAAADGRVIVEEWAVPQSVVMFGQNGPLRDDPDFYAMTVVNHVLGGGSFTSRLYQEVREARGLAYSIRTGLRVFDSAGLIVGQAATANERVAETLDVIREEWRRAAAGDISAAAIADAKTFLTGSYPLRFTSSGRIAAMLVAIQLDRLGIDYIDRRNQLIEAVTVDAANQAAQRWLDPASLTMVVVGEPQGVTGSP